MTVLVNKIQTDRLSLKAVERADWLVSGVQQLVGAYVANSSNCEPYILPTTMFILGVDIGSTSVKVALSKNGNLVS